ncbi:hypothetical protein J0A67_06125 [Algoriphagus aestuariicola]|uniref:DUF3575 domain-containing protein n=1 Tax=Algoriphagus aestuariicola TaxID=1852016 RepID=A0ABS3BM88_9BACT|nr:hypothetical protein [Algoriphagus aestuariicola]MBN7800428.1 hypothetical protein [Algoriphagus aestuariicola]
MKTRIYLFFSLLSLFCTGLQAQDVTPRDYRNFPITLTLQFQSFSLPFRNMGSNFKNLGVGLGTEVSHGGDSHDWVQEFSVFWIRNKNMGNGLYLMTQTAWRPYLGKPFFGEIKAGIGYKMAFRPSESYVQRNGEWISIGKKGKGMLAIPLGIGLGVHDYSEGTYTSPFVNYQAVFLKGYNQDIPLVPETIFQFGMRTHLKDN